MSRVAVVGATGCVGRHVCAAVEARGDQVLAIARRPAPPTGSARFVPLDIATCSARSFADLLRREDVEAVVNVTTGWGGTEEVMRRLNVRPVDRLLDALAMLPAPPRLVHVGTIHEYGPVPHGVAIDETVRPNPVSPYARAKHAASELVLTASRARVTDCVVLRVANTIGPWPAEESFLGSLTRDLRATARTGEPLEVTVAEAQRDYVDVRDAAEAAVLACWSTSADPLVNIGSGAALPMRGLVEELIKTTGLASELVTTRNGEVSSRGADWTRVDTSRARDLLGWSPRHTVSESLRDMWDSGV